MQSKNATGSRRGCSKIVDAFWRQADDFWSNHALILCRAFADAPWRNTARTVPDQQEGAIWKNQRGSIITTSHLATSGALQFRPIRAYSCSFVVAFTIHLRDKRGKVPKNFNRPPGFPSSGSRRTTDLLTSDRTSFKLTERAVLRARHAQFLPIVAPYRGDRRYDTVDR
jgi:hypothetical protein